MADGVLFVQLKRSWKLYLVLALLVQEDHDPQKHCKHILYMYSTEVHVYNIMLYLYMYLNPV